MIAAGNRTRAEVDSRLTARVQRGKLLNSQFSGFTAVVGEAALRQGVLGPTEMIDQLSHLLAVTEKPHTSLHVVPMGVGFHIGLNGQFSIPDFDSLQPIVFYENLEVGREYQGVRAG